MTDATASTLSEALRDRYALERELGRGGMARVYLARDVRHRRHVALKVLHPEIAQTVGSVRFLREIETAASLQHPHIVPLFDSGEADGLLYYVMPYVEGESLRSRLAREKHLPIDEALEIAHQVCSALAYAHAQGVIHRDIKPENILLKGDQAIVADFGIARAVSESGGAGLTGTGLVIGTPAYMSPEQASAARDLDGRSDLYSMACVLYEMLAGHAPFSGMSDRAVMARHAIDPVPSLRSVRLTVQRVKRRGAVAPFTLSPFTFHPHLCHPQPFTLHLLVAHPQPRSRANLSAEFERWWNENHIETSQEGVKHYEHPEAGQLVFDYSVLEVLDERMSSLRLVAYVPAPGTETREKMEKLLRIAEPVLPVSLESV